jgi:hypothetical protein
MDSLAHQNIETFARFLYQLGGRPKNRDKDHWYRAERELSENLFCDEYPMGSTGRTRRKSPRLA